MIFSTVAPCRSHGHGHDSDYRGRAAGSHSTRTAAASLARSRYQRLKIKMFESGLGRRLSTVSAKFSLKTKNLETCNKMPWGVLIGIAALFFVLLGDSVGASTYLNGTENAVKPENFTHQSNSHCADESFDGVPLSFVFGVSILLVHLICTLNNGG